MPIPSRLAETLIVQKWLLPASGSPLTISSHLDLVAVLRVSCVCIFMHHVGRLLETNSYVRCSVSGPQGSETIRRRQYFRYAGASLAYPDTDR